MPESHPAIINAPIPAGRPGVPVPPPAAAAPPPVQAEAALATADPPQIEAPFAEAPPRRFEGRAFSDKRFPVGRAAHLPTIRAQAAAARVPVDLADAVATVESAYDPHAVGLVDEIGLMQVRPAIARQLGFEGTIQDLFEPETNIRLGMIYLAGAWERSGGNLCQALMKYRAGWDETQMSALSLEYCRRAVVHLTAIGSPLARGVTVPTGAATPPPGQRSTSQFNWQDHESRMRQIDNRFGGQNFGIIAR
ncbi:MAG: transglycosylase SLT domain-containing protein [Phreatobacter sp.]|nr:transglycosylase SLT domain-containing protein [Phreatobacter sp.]